MTCWKAATRVAGWIFLAYSVNGIWVTYTGATGSVWLVPGTAIN